MQMVPVSIETIAEQGLPRFPVTVLEKDIAAVIAPQDDMIEAAGDE
jgi:hypothetical protein